MTEQEIFNVVWTRLKTQGFERSYEWDEWDTGDCKYRDPSGRVCAVGALIPDDKYRPDFEGHTVDSPTIGNFILEATGLPKKFLPFLEKLQNAHDGGDTPRYMEDCFRQIAYDHNLTVPGE